VENRKYIEEDEIDLRELFLTLWEKKVFIIVFTSIVTIGTIIFSLSKEPVYEIKGFVEIGSISKYNNSNAIVNPHNVVKKLEILYQNSNVKNEITNLDKVSVVKSTTNLIELSIHSNSNENGMRKFEEILIEIKKEHNKIVLDYIKKYNVQIENLKKQKELLSSGTKFEGSERIKFDMTREIDNLELLISNSNIKYTELMGKVMKNDYPIKPKKKLIVIVGFISGFMLSIFLVFFINFVQSLKEKETLS
jgi:LPS O-antigen subunit length determinant protein (WzzB/FepE family)